MVLYGFQTYSIQKYIFASNKLREIVGASAQIDSLAKKHFPEFAKQCGESISKDNILREAGGSGFFLLDDSSVLPALWPLYVELAFPGLNISYATVSVENNITKEHIKNLYEKLEENRNFYFSAKEPASPLARISPSSGLPAVAYKKDSFLDREAESKLESSKSQEIEFRLQVQKSLKKENLPFDVGMLTSDKFKNFIAVIHIDGNHLGALNLEFYKKASEEEYAQQYKEFTSTIATITEAAYKKAWQETIGFKKTKDGKLVLEARTIILGGDDLTILTSPEKALPFTKTFLEEFERQSKEKLQKFKLSRTHLTACAGIVFMKKNYPFFRAVHIAEELCSAAKKESKSADKGAPSSVYVMKVIGESLDSFAEYVKRKREWGLLVHNQKKVFRLGAGALFLNQQYGLSLEQFMQTLQELKHSSVSKGGLKDVLARLQTSYSDAEARYNRLKQVTEEKNIFKKIESLASQQQKDSFSALFRLQKESTKGEEGKEIHFIPLYDLLSLLDFVEEKADQEKKEIAS
ncbi:MAG: hypothetical protein D6767_10900 [Candidatus Hydrogenedentota bacterium]|nr:MAG: hypothetical protein D6767_10900 [Candidatus Hydrogenedentota bacterium]